jgi:hypothetical protein
MRYIRVPYNDGADTRLVWISTEIVSPAFFTLFYEQNRDLNGTAWTWFGDSSTNISGGYGDLTFSYRQM